MKHFCVIQGAQISARVPFAAREKNWYATSVENASLAS